ncbi:hypothetical protein BJF83_12015 [Nocardiopsis sp. CNR-923]|nr:hypothetical protein BJF83_12015 [Nocardiopsis sp. CNR-923]
MPGDDRPPELAFRADPLSPTPREHVMTVPSAGLVRSELRERVLNSSFVRSSPSDEEGLRIVYPLPGRRARDTVAATVPVAC